MVWYMTGDEEQRDVCEDCDGSGVNKKEEL